jgi:hypothetical protein
MATRIDSVLSEISDQVGNLIAEKASEVADRAKDGLKKGYSVLRFKRGDGGIWGAYLLLVEVYPRWKSTLSMAMSQCTQSSKRNAAMVTIPACSGVEATDVVEVMDSRPNLRGWKSMED